MKKILFFIPTLSHGGAEKVLVNLVNNMDRTKYEITVQTIFGGGVNEKFLKDDIRYISIYKKPFKGFSKITKVFSPQHLYKKYIKDDYNILVSYLEGVTARIISGCTNPNTKKVSWIHSDQHTKEMAANNFRSYDEAKKCYESFDNTVCVSKTVLDDFKKVMDFQSPIQVLYNTNETDRIKQLANEPVTDIQFDKDTVNICCVGKIVNTKGQDKLARIHKKLLDNGIKNHMYMLGVGEDQPKIELYLKENNLENTFTFLGYNENPYKYVKNCDLYVCASLREGFSTAVTESIIVGTPVVTTLCSGMKEIFGENNEYGIITENDEDALYSGVLKMLTTCGLLGQYAERAAQRGKVFSTENTVSAVENMLETL